MNFHDTLQDILSHDDTFRYRLLSRMKSDCEYYLGHGNRHPKYLWGTNEVEHIAYMKALWNSFPEDGKPEWLSYDKILEYEIRVGIPAILVERDYKGSYERFALTPEEFEKEYPETVVKGTWPIQEAATDTIAPLVHLWFSPCMVRDAAWERHFSDMAYGLPESDIAAGNLACIREDLMQSLGIYLEGISVYHCRAVCQHENLSLAVDKIVEQFIASVEAPDFKIVNLKCVEENKAEVGDEFPGECIFTFECDIKMRRDSQTDINKILENVDGGELLSHHYERSDEKTLPSIDKLISDALRQGSDAAAEMTPEQRDRVWNNIKSRLNFPDGR